MRKYFPLIYVITDSAFQKYQIIPKKTFLLILVIVISQSLVFFSQTTKIDSLENLLKQNVQSDTVRVLLLNETAYELIKIDEEKTLRYTSESRKLADELKFAKGKTWRVSEKFTYLRKEK